MNDNILKKIKELTKNNELKKFKSQKNMIEFKIKLDKIKNIKKNNSPLLNSKSNIFQKEMTTTILNSNNNEETLNELKIGNDKNLLNNTTNLNRTNLFFPNYFHQNKKNNLKKLLITKGTFYPKIINPLNNISETIKEKINKDENKNNISLLNTPKNKSQVISFYLSNTNSIYLDLSRKKRINNETNLKSQSVDFSYKKLFKKFNDINNNKKKFHIINSPLNSIHNYNLFCKKNNKPILQTLKYHLANYWDNRYELIADFLKKNRMSNLINRENIDNFSYYLKRNFEMINFEVPMNNIILNGIKFNPKIKTKNKLIECNILNNLNSKNKNIDNNNLKDNKFHLENIKNCIKKRYKNSKSKNKELMYFNHKTGKIDTYLDSNLFANMTKQKEFYEKEILNHSHTPFSKNSIKLFNDNDLKELQEEINNLDNLNSDRNNDKRNTRLYYKLMKKQYNKNPEYLPRKKHKLLEYIILQNIKNKNALIKDLQN